MDCVRMSSNFVEKKLKSEKCLEFTWGTPTEHYLFVCLFVIYWSF